MVLAGIAVKGSRVLSNIVQRPPNPTLFQVPGDYHDPGHSCVLRSRSLSESRAPRHSPRLKPRPSSRANPKGREHPSTGRSGKLNAQAVSTARLATFMAGPQLNFGYPVVDRNGLGGVFTFTLEWTPDDVFDALQEQLGLKLEVSKAEVDVIIRAYTADSRPALPNTPKDPPPECLPYLFLDPVFLRFAHSKLRNGM